MGNFKKKFLYKECKACEYTVGQSTICKDCVTGSMFSELYNTDKNCIHKVKAVESGGVKCIKCGGWFCY